MGSRTLEAYVESFASSGRYRDFGELAAARSFNLRTYGSAAGTAITRNGDTTYTVTDGPNQFGFAVPDFDVRSLRSNVGADGLGDAFRIPGDHFLALKVSYWIAAR
ncbi:MAG: hypothetical protein ACREL9_09500 [Gemmatimonadales bacterium]